MRSRWRAILFALIAGGSILAGVGFQIAAHHGDQSDDAVVNPLRIGVWTDTPSAPIRVEIQLFHGQDKSTVAAVFLSSPGAQRVLITSSMPGNHFRKLNPSVQLSGYLPYYEYFTQGSIQTAADERGLEIAEYKMPSNVFESDASRTVIKMPTIAAYEDSTQYIPAYATVVSDPAGAPYGNISVKSNKFVGSRDPTHWIARGAPTAPYKLFWNPQHLTTVESAQGLYPLTNLIVNVNEPANGIATADTYQWTGSYGLIGSLQAESRSDQEQRSNDEFYSGLAFATGAAALVALIQEGPDRIHRRRRILLPTNVVSRAALKSKRALDR